MQGPFRLKLRGDLLPLRISNWLTQGSNFQIGFPRLGFERSAVTKFVSPYQIELCRAAYGGNAVQTGATHRERTAVIAEQTSSGSGEWVR